MKILAVTIRVKQEKILVARSLLQSLVAPSRAEAGCVQYELFQSTDDPQIFYFFEKWKDDEAFAEHGAQPLLKEFHSRYDELLAEPNRVMWLKAVDDK